MTTHGVEGDKGSLRRDLMDARDALPPTDRAGASVRACSHLLARPGLDDVGVGDAWALYVAVGSEADPAHLVEAGSALGARILLPRVVGTTLELADATSTSPGFAGISEPTGPVAELDRVRLIVVAGIAFDRQGNRLGRGGGHYDRLLAALPASTLRVGLCFSSQVVASLPHAEHDEPVDLLATEDGVITTGAR